MISGLMKGQVDTVIEESGKHDHSGTSGVVFSGLPMHKEDYAEDVQQIMDEAIETHGREEWRLAVIASELHGHLGIYAIIGVKMGLYARELLDVGLDEVKIQSFAGLNPPVSCLNDGLQVSTGATLGHGLIQAGKTDAPRASARFIKGDQILELTLRQEKANEIRGMIREALKSSGGLTDEYWQKVRVHALDIWNRYDRKEIFEQRLIMNNE